MAGFEIPFGVQPTNPVAVDAWSGPYTGASIENAKALANSSIPSIIRFQTMEVRLIVGSQGYKYWYRGGTFDSDLVEFASTSSGISGPYVSFFNGFTGGVTLAVGTGITLTQSNGVITIDATGETTVVGATGATGATGPQGNTGNTGQGTGYTAIGLSGGFLWVSPVDINGVRGASFSIGYVQGNTGNTGTEGPGYTAIGLSGSELWISPVVAGVRGASYSLGIVRGNTGNTGDPGARGNTGNTGDPGARGDTGATGPTDIQSTNSSGTFYPLFASGTGNTAIYIDNVTTPFTYVPSTGSLTGRSFIATNGTNITTISVANITLDNGVDSVSFSENAFSHSGTIPFALSSDNRLRLSGSTIEFYGSGYGYTFPSVNGTSGQALLTRGNGGLYWGTVSTSGGGGGGGTTLFAGTGITLATSGAGTTVSTILGMTATSVGFEISGGVSQAFLGVCGGAVTIVGTAGSNLEFEFPSVSTTLVGVHNTVSGISGATGDIGLVAGSNVTITQSGRTFTIASSGSGGVGNTGATGATGPQGATGATGPTNIQSTNSSATFYPLFAGGTGDTAIYVDPTTTPFTYVPQSGRLNARILGLSASAGTIVSDSGAGSITLRTDPEIVSLTTIPGLDHNGTLPFSITAQIGLTLNAPVISFANPSGDLYTFPGNTGSSGYALLTRQNGQLYWGTVSTSGGGGGGTTLFAGIGITLATSGAGTTVSTILGMTATVVGFEISGGSFSSSLGVCGGAVTIVGTAGSNLEFEFPSVSTTLVGVHNTVSGISGATGSIGLVAGTNVTITQSGRTFTIASSSGSGTPAGSAGYVQYYAASGFSADNGLVYDSSLESLRIGSTTRYLTLYTSGTDSIVEGNGNSSLYLQHTNPVYVGDGIANGNNTYLVVDDSLENITLNSQTVDILGNVSAPNIVNGISGSTGNIGLVAGSNVTITQSGRTFTINSSGSGSPSGNYVNTYDGRTGDVVTPPLLLYSLGII